MTRRVTRREDEVWFALDLDGNRALKPEEQFQVKLRPLSGEDLMRVKRQHGGLTDGELNFVGRAQDTRDQLIEEYVSGVRNYEVELPNGDLFTPTTGPDLTKAVKLAGGNEPEAVLDPIIGALVDSSKLNGGLVKN
jgi:hypothetical protein